MFKGFYNLTSGMLTQGRNLDVISNNMTNVATAGFKADKYTASTFDEVMWSRVGNKDKSYADIGRQSYILASSQLYTNYAQGSFDETGLPLDFAIEGSGYFAIETNNGRAYTRAGNFLLDGEGYLALPGQGRVLDDTGEPIQLVTDKITTDRLGGLYTDNGVFLGRIGVYAFADEAQLTKNEQGLFTADAQPALSDAAVHSGMLERSNVDLIEQMVGMMASQRAYQSAAQVSKMYDQLMTKATNDVGRL